MLSFTEKTTYQERRRSPKINTDATLIIVIHNEATVHWLRHTGIFEDVKSRPREHVRDDAGHSSGAITDRYTVYHLNNTNNKT